MIGERISPSNLNRLFQRFFAKNYDKDETYILVLVQWYIQWRIINQTTHIQRSNQIESLFV